MKKEAQILGLEVIKAKRCGKAIEMFVKWEKEANLRMDSAICLQEETVTLLHPCGRVVCQNCAKKLPDKKGCLFCRQQVRSVRPVSNLDTPK